MHLAYLLGYLLIIHILGRPCQHLRQAEALNMVLSQLAGYTAQIPYINTIAVQHIFQLSTTHGDLLEVFETPNYCLDVRVLQLLT